MIRQKKSGPGDRVGQSSRSGSSSSHRKSESPKARGRSDGSPNRIRIAETVESSDERTKKKLNRTKLEKTPKQVRCPSLPSASSDEDIDPELKEGIHNIMKLRDEYDKLEGALRKLGVEPADIKNNRFGNADENFFHDENEFSDYEEDEEASLRPLNPIPPPLILPADDLSSADFSAISADPFGNSNVFSCDESLQPRTARLGHLEILEEVDESVLSSEAGDDPPLPPPPPPSYPWIQMALPGGGVVTVPLHPDSSLQPDSRSLHSTGSHQTKALASQVSGPHAPLPSVTSGADLLTVPAGEPITHFNLDQLLEIVQSFQLDTTMASHEQGSNNIDLGALMQQAPEPPVTQTSTEESREKKSSGCDVKNCDIKKKNEREGQPEGSGAGSTTVREIQSCPSSPTETECSSGFSTLRRRSVTLTEKIRTSKDGSKTQVVRQYGCNTSSAGEANQTMTFQQKSFVYINGAKVSIDDEGQEVVDEMGGTTSQSFPSLLPITSTSQVSSSHQVTSHSSFQHHHGATTLPRSSIESSSHRGATQTMTRGQHFVRLNSLEPNTVMFNTKDYPILSDITVPEIIDELEKQFSDKLCDLQGVRLVANNVYICLSRRESLQHLSTYGFYVRGVPVKLLDITHDSVVICLSGVPHYITDATITMLVGTFGVAIGEVERRFYKGVDTGERYVRLKPRSHTQVPDQVTVGGCKIFITVLSNEEVCQPYILQSATADPPQPGLSTAEAYNCQTTAHFANSSIMASTSSDRGSGVPGNFRAKPGHCNGTVNSPSEAPCTSQMMMSFSSRCDDSSSLPASPKIGKSFRSRLTMGLKSPTNEGEDEVDRTYVPGEPLDFPSLSPPPYKTPSSAGSSSTSNGGRHAMTLLASNKLGGSSFDESKKLGNRKYRQSNKTDSSTSLASQPGKPEPTGVAKRTSVVFEEPRAPTITTATSHSSSSTMPPNPCSTLSRAAMATSKTVNGILRKGSVPGDDIVTNPPPTQKSVTAQLNLSGSGPPQSKLTLSKNNNDRDSLIEKDSEKSLHHQRKSRKSKEKHSSSKSGRSRSSKLDSLPESGPEDGDSTLPRSSRSRSSSSKSSSKADKTAKDLALTRDLPWCGCWGNGCL